MMLTQPSLAYLRLNSIPTFTYAATTVSGISIIPSAIPQFAVFENTGNVSLIGWSGSTPSQIFSGVYTCSFKITGTAGFEVGKSYNVVASSYMFTKPKIETIATFLVSDYSFDSFSGYLTTNYAADIEMIQGTGNSNIYTVQWRVDGGYITGLTSAYLSLYKTDGTTQFLSRPMFITGSNNIFASYTALGSEIITSGARYIAVTSGTIGGQLQFYSRIIGRDS